MNMKEHQERKPAKRAINHMSDRRTPPTQTWPSLSKVPPFGMRDTQVPDSSVKPMSSYSLNGFLETCGDTRLSTALVKAALPMNEARNVNVVNIVNECNEVDNEKESPQSGRAINFQRVLSLDKHKELKRELK